MICALIVEDEVLAAEALVEFVGRIPGFEVAGHARTGVDALHRLAVGSIDLVLLDIYLPDMSGLELLRRVRGAGNIVDIIAVTRARDIDVVQAAVSYGVTQYMVKPFTFNTVRQRLERYQAYRARRADHSLLVAQQDIDHLLGELRDPGEDTALPKGISQESLRAVVVAVRSHRGGGGSRRPRSRPCSALPASPRGGTSSTSSRWGWSIATRDTTEPVAPRSSTRGLRRTAMGWTPRISRDQCSHAGRSPLTSAVRNNGREGRLLADSKDPRGVRILNARDRLRKMKMARGGRLRPRDRSLASQLFALQTLIVLVGLAILGR